MIAETRNMEAVKAFMDLPEIWRYCSEYGANKDRQYDYSKKNVWLAYMIGDKHAGLINLYVISGSACQCHPYIKRKYASKYEDMLKELFVWFCEYMPPEAIKLNALVPTKFRQTIKAVKNVGGKVEGVDRLSYRAKTRIYDRIMLGITREEMKNG